MYLNKIKKMIKECGVDLYRYSTMRTHSVAKQLYTPESIDELVSLMKELNCECHFLGGGSNVVFANTVNKPVINLMSLNDEVLKKEENLIYAGCSVRIQKLINFAKEYNLGGFEYLYSLPASVGGIIYMNAGRGRRHNQQISDWLQSVEYLDLTDFEKKVMQFEKEKWTYRASPFKKMNAVILGASFRMEHKDRDIVESEIQKRKRKVQKSQEGNKPSCGSVFNKFNKYIMYLLRGFRIGGARFSKKTVNWISNDKNGSGDDVVKLINFARFLHRITFQKSNVEIKIFE